MWWSAWTCSSSIKSNIQCQIGFKFKYANNIVSERSTSPSPSPSPPSLETEQMSFNINCFRFSAHFYALVVIQPAVDGCESISLQQKLSAHSTNFNRATNMLNGNIKHNVFISFVIFYCCYSTFSFLFFILPAFDRMYSCSFAVGGVESRFWFSYVTIIVLAEDKNYSMKIVNCLRFGGVSKQKAKFMYTKEKC